MEVNIPFLKLLDSFYKTGPNLSILPVHELDQNRVDYMTCVSVDNHWRLSPDLLS